MSVFQKMLSVPVEHFFSDLKYRTDKVKILWQYLIKIQSPNKYRFYKGTEARFWTLVTVKK